MHLSPEMHFLRGQLFRSLWLLISLAAALYFLSKFSLQVSIGMYKYEPRIMANWLQSN